MTGLLIFLAGIDQKGEQAMDEKKYTDIMYEGSYEHPLYLNDGKIVLTGEGGNRHILISAGDGWIDVWVDLHIYKRAKEAFIGLFGGVTFTGHPNPNVVRDVLFDILRYSDFSKTQSSTCQFSLIELNKLFEELVKDAR